MGRRRGAPAHPGGWSPAGERDPAGEFHGAACHPAERHGSSGCPAGEYHGFVNAKETEPGNGRHVLVRWVMIMSGVDLSGGGEPYGAGGAYGWAASGQPVNEEVLYSPQVAP